MRTAHGIVFVFGLSKISLLTAPLTSCCGLASLSTMIVDDDDDDDDETRPSSLTAAFPDRQPGPLFAARPRGEREHRAREIDSGAQRCAAKRDDCGSYD